MKDAETIRQFIQLRAEGKSYGIIAAELNISKSTCVKWERDLKAEIDELAQIRLDELHTAYRMTTEARIKALGETLEKINSALAEKDLSDLPADKLLTLKLRYTDALKAEYRETPEPEEPDDLNGLLAQYSTLYRQSRSGQIPPAAVKAQLSILSAKSSALKAKTQEDMYCALLRDMYENNRDAPG